MQLNRTDEKSKAAMQATRDALWQDPATYLRRAHLSGIAFAAFIAFVFKNTLTTAQLVGLFIVLWLATQLAFLYFATRSGRIRYSWQQILTQWLKSYIMAAILIFVLDRIGWLRLSSWL